MTSGRRKSISTAMPLGLIVISSKMEAAMIRDVLTFFLKIWVLLGSLYGAVLLVDRYGLTPPPPAEWVKFISDARAVVDESNKLADKAAPVAKAVSDVANAVTAPIDLMIKLTEVASKLPGAGGGGLPIPGGGGLPIPGASALPIPGAGGGGQGPAGLPRPNLIPDRVLPRQLRGLGL